MSDMHFDRLKSLFCGNGTGLLAQLFRSLAQEFLLGDIRTHIKAQYRLGRINHCFIPWGMLNLHFCIEL